MAAFDNFSPRPSILKLAWHWVLQEKVKLESLATELISAVESHNLYHSVEHSDKSSFKIRSANFPPTLANKLKCLKSNSTTFGGARGQRVSTDLVCWDAAIEALQEKVLRQLQAT